MMKNLYNHLIIIHERLCGYGTDCILETSLAHAPLKTKQTTKFVFSPFLCRYWLCAAFGPSIKIWDLESKEMVEELRPEVVSSATSKAEPPQCLSLAWSTDGQTLFAGYSDNTIRVWQVSVTVRN